uniref:Putative ovule protein n=1 Tax=Solanum chacoense TaxID=4108 RepID=A0A0V0GSJ0_SOLCH
MDNGVFRQLVTSTSTLRRIGYIKSKYLCIKQYLKKKAIKEVETLTKHLWKVSTWNVHSKPLPYTKNTIILSTTG